MDRSVSDSHHDYVGGRKAVDIVYNSRSSEEQVVNNDVLVAVSGDNYEDFVQANKEGPINSQTECLPTSLTPHPPQKNDQGVRELGAGSIIEEVCVWHRLRMLYFEKPSGEVRQ